MTPSDPVPAVDDFKDTLFLPSTAFPLKADLPIKEPAIQQRWKETDLYGQQRRQSTERKKWILHWGPPYANGAAHIGHAFTKSLKDVVVRTMQMMGYDAPLVPGWDCHGLPIEWKIEEKYRAEGKDKDAVPLTEFRAECRRFAQHWADVQSHDFQRLGVNADWANPYMTMHNASEAAIVREIHRFAANGGLYRGVKPVLWSVVEKTALAEAEVEYKEHKSTTVWIGFPVRDTDFAPIKDAQIVIWTTTPWTLPSNRALAFGTDIPYAVYTVLAVAEGSLVQPGAKLVIATDLADSVRTAAKIESWDQGDVFKGSQLKDTICHHPLYKTDPHYDSFPVPMLAGDFVTSDAGTGFVHIAPGHGEDDYWLFMTHFGAANIPDNVDDAGRFRDHVPLFAGKTIYTDKGETGDANGAVIKAMIEAGALVAKGSLRHDYPHSWRSKAPLIFRTTPQWFISMDTNDLRAKALAAIKDVRWIPSAGENRITAMIAGRPDWCISRQRAWGVPIAVFVNKKTGALLTDPAVFDRIDAAFQKDGADAWYTKPASDFLGPDYTADDFEKINDIVDVWFESGATHAFVCEARDDLHSPADLYLEGSDQHRGWFHSSLLESCGTRGRAPYRAVLTHGFVLDAKGYKMSKSLGNVIDPHDVMKEWGADILRLWAITSDYSDDIRIGKDTLKGVGDLYRRIRNTLRFVLGALDGFTDAESVPLDDPKALPELERYVLSELAALDTEIRSDVAAFEFGRATQRLHHFCTNTLSSFYFDVRKDRLYCDRPDLFERRACRTVMKVLFEFLVTWFAPVLPFTTDEAWQHRPRLRSLAQDSVHLCGFPALPLNWCNADLTERWDRIRAIRRVITGALEIKRADKTIGSSLEAAPTIYLTPPLAAQLDGIDWAEIAITSEASVVIGDAPPHAFRMPDVAGVGVVFAPARGEKCARSWRIVPDVGSDPDYPSLSARDADAVRFYRTHARAA